MIDYRFFHEDRLLVVCQAGRSDLTEVHEMRTRIRQDPGFTLSYDVIVDVSRLAQQFEMLQMQSLAETRERKALQFGKLALISGANELAFGVLRQYASLADQQDGGIETQVFREPGQALGWLDRAGFDLSAAIDDMIQSNQL